MDTNFNTESNIKTNNLPGFVQALLLIALAQLITLLIAPVAQVIGKLVPIVAQWNLFIVYTLSFGLVLLIAKKWWKVTDFDTKGVNIIVYLMVLPLIFAMGIVMEGVVNLIPMPEFFRALFEQMIPLNLAGYLAIGIAAPILEELIFRGVVLKKYLEKYYPGKAIVLSAAVFGIAHLNPWQFIAAFVIGIAIGWIYWKTKSIWPGIFIHFVNNSFSFYLAKKYQNINISFTDIIGNTFYYVSLIVLCLFICYAVYLFLDKYFNKIAGKIDAEY